MGMSMSNPCCADCAAIRRRLFQLFLAACLAAAGGTAAAPLGDRAQPLSARLRLAGPDFAADVPMEWLKKILEKEIGKPGVEQVLFTNFVMQ